MNFPWVEIQCDLTSLSSLIYLFYNSLTVRPEVKLSVGQQNIHQVRLTDIHCDGKKTKECRYWTTCLNASLHLDKLVTLNSSPYKLWVTMWWGLYMREAVWVCLSPSLCRNLQTHLVRHKQQWPGKIVEIPPTYQGIWGFGLTIHTDTHSQREIEVWETGEIQGQGQIA